MSNQLAIIKKSVVDVVASKIKQFQSSHDLQLPPNYSPENAMKSAFLILQNTMDKNKQPVLTSCTHDSIANSLLDMIIQGLNPAKKQCYFIAYGKQLTCMRSYHGAKAVVKSLCGATDVVAQVVWEGDEFEYEILDGNKAVTRHAQKLQNVGQNPVGAYCVIVFPDTKYTDIMTIAQIKKSWEKSKDSGLKTHKDFSEEMIKRTVINRACKHFINASSDNALLLERINRPEPDPETDMQKEIENNANSIVIDFQPTPSLTAGELVDAEYEMTDEEKQEIINQEVAEAKAEGPGF